VDGHVSSREEEGKQEKQGHDTMPDSATAIRNELCLDKGAIIFLRMEGQLSVGVSGCVCPPPMLALNDNLSHCVYQFGVKIADPSGR